MAIKSTIIAQQSDMEAAARAAFWRSKSMLFKFNGSRGARLDKSPEPLANPQKGAFYGKVQRYRGAQQCGRGRQPEQALVPHRKPDRNSFPVIREVEQYRFVHKIYGIRKNRDPRYRPHHPAWRLKRLFRQEKSQQRSKTAGKERKL